MKLSAMLALLLAIAIIAIENAVGAFSVTRPSAAYSTPRGSRGGRVVADSHSSGPVLSRLILNALEDESSSLSTEEGAEDDPAKRTLEDKMKQWEASEEEIKASSLGGVTPQRSDAFDIGLYIAFPFMILASLAFAFFPFIMDKIDVSSVGPPPTV